MGRKNVLLPVYVSHNAANNSPITQSLTADFNTVSTDLQYQDPVIYQINITTSNSVGTFFLQCSADDVNFVDVGQAAVVNTANDTAIVEYDLNRTAPYVRLRYASNTAGTGTCTILISAKQIGG